MTMRDGFSDFSFFQCAEPQRVDSADLTGADVDTRGFETTTIVFEVGRLSDISGASYWVGRLQHTQASALGLGPSDYTDVASNDVIRLASGAVTSGICLTLNVSTLGSARYPVGYVGDNRYARGVVEHKNANSTADFGITAIRGLPNIAPVNTPNLG